MRAPGRSIADAAADVLRVADLLGMERFVVTGYSGGGPHALAVGALGGDRVLGVATFGSPAPFSDDGAWFEGMQDPGALRSARDGRAAREEWEETARFDPEQFTGDDYSALDGPLTALGAEAGRASEPRTGRERRRRPRSRQALGSRPLAPHGAGPPPPRRGGQSGPGRPRGADPPPPPNRGAHDPARSRPHRRPARLAGRPRPPPRGRVPRGPPRQRRLSAHRGRQRIRRARWAWKGHAREG
ncbi:alpha/beta fold hydrolase, partial [Rathayibacter sp. AY1D2]|uniref:alpha/beta fold hydrolase n=1 Tax=Rathayibacter sp. AY1D2 TaxID=2080543 RepID=UPI0035BE7721